MSEVYYTSMVQKLEADREAKKASIAKRDAIQRLMNNPDFKNIILNEFCVTECARYVEMAGSPQQSEASRANSLNIAMAGGHLQRYLSTQMQMTATAERDIQALEYELEQARADEGAN